MPAPGGGCSGASLPPLAGPTRMGQSRRPLAASAAGGLPAGTMPKDVRKAVVLAAGLGTRFLPATKVLAKELLPLVDRPIIHYVAEEAVAAGLKTIVLVTSWHKRGIEDYFDRAADLESFLERAGRLPELAALRAISEMANIIAVRQREQRGTGDALLAAAYAVGDEPFLLIFPDDVIVSEVPVAAQMVEVFRRYGSCVVAVEKVPLQEVGSYGIVEGVPVEERVVRVTRLVEKPEPSEVTPDAGGACLAIVGRYVFGPEIFDILRETPPGRGGEVQVTDAMATLSRSQPVYAYRFCGTRYDTGRPLGLLRASLELALRRPDMGPELRKLLPALTLPQS